MLDSMTVYDELGMTREPARRSALRVLATAVLAMLPLQALYAQAPGEVDALIEIPAGSITKYEIDAATGALRVDRFQSMPVVYPANYGTLPGTLAGDDDPLDILVYTREPIVPGALIRVRPIGVLRMKDGGAQDDKVVAVPVEAVDPSYARIRDIQDLPEIELQRLQAFFRTYKQLPAGREQIVLEDVGGHALATRLIQEAMTRHSELSSR